MPGVVVRACLLLTRPPDAPRQWWVRQSLFARPGMLFDSLGHPFRHAQWVFCSAWDRANNDCPTPGWGCGACANPTGGCYVGSWNTTDTSLQNWTFTQALTLPGHYTVPNVGVGMVPTESTPPSPLPRHSAFMALEMSFDTPGPEGNAMAVNVGTNGDLGTNWIFLDPQVGFCG